MAAAQPFSVPLQGGLVKSNNSLELLQIPGSATILKNFEVSTKGGYRRIDGYTKFGEGSAVQPSGGTATILGVFPYADGVIATVGTNIYFSNTGTSWLQINRSSVAGGGDNYTTFTGRSTLARTGQGQCQFVLFEGATYDYGEVIIADGANKLYSFRMEGTGALTDRTFFAFEITVDGTNGVKYITIHDHHLIASGVADNLNTLYYSVYNDPDNFTGTGAGAVTISDQVQGIKGFREDLIVFAENSLHKLVNINDSSNIRIDPIAENVGCLSGYSIQEIGGDLIFLAPDGLRTVAGTARIGDVELGTVSKAVQPVINDLVRSINDFTISSMVHRDKSQYRLFYTDTSLSNSQQKGIIGTLRPQGFEWSETVGIEVTAIETGFDNNGIEQRYHGDTDGFIFKHDSGNSFNGSNILAEYQSPDFDYGDFGTLKTLDYIKISFFPEGDITPSLRVRYDYADTDLLQPDDFSISADGAAVFGTAVFGSAKFGGVEQPLVKVSLIGSGYSNSFKIFSEDTNAPYTINGLYVNYRPSGRQ